MSEPSPGLNKLEVADLVRHIRQMLRPVDTLSILVRGMSMIDEAVLAMLQTYSEVIDRDARPTPRGLGSRLDRALYYGVLASGEAICIRALAKLRNSVAHALAAEISVADEARLVSMFQINCPE